MMKLKFFGIILIILISLSAILLFLASSFSDDPALNIFVGVDVAYDNVEEIKRLADEMSPYINTVIIGSTGITHNFTKLNDVCQYLYNKSMYFMIYAHPVNDPEELAVQRQWILDAKPKWGERFLGLYAYDEPAGRQLDNATLKAVHDDHWFADNWTDAANKYITRMNLILNVSIQEQMGGLYLPLFTSDYALYWFDYKVGYDVVFAEFGWNYSRHINVALCRGAATVQNKDWGVMITWTYTAPPYLESGEALYNDLVLAYESGAKYIFVFDTNKDYTHSVLQPEHLDALKRFWCYAKNNPRSSSLNHNRIAYVLPKDYGYGFRGPADKIWGLWEADDFAIKLSTEVSMLIDKYQNRLDIIYDDEFNGTYGYSKIIFWNGTVWAT
ncbi:MAG: hypothetical protein QXF14_02695 [Candidatus Woesearchaeota archaeon]